MSERSRRPNHLAGQTSPYLLQHLHNPVDWYAWTPEALERARALDRPIFLSVGYAACHWCHVMERESFEDRRVAELLNQHFVPVKVDREERPDIDEIYMNAVQLMTGQGGWPLSVFLTPQREPFMGGTYFPPEDRHGRIGFASLLERIHAVWVNRRRDVERSAQEMTDELRRVLGGLVAAPAGAAEASGPGAIERAAAELAGRFDPTWGGFGHAPKFPPDGALALLLRLHARSGAAAPLAAVERTLEGMARGGIYDHIGGGFARYSVDERWLVPHFEKMLYNQALLVANAVDAWRITRRPLYRRVVEQTLDFVARELTSDEGGFYCSLDADSEGEEGRFYLWTPVEVAAILGPRDGARFCTIYDVTAAGNFEGRSIPNLLAGSLAERAATEGLTEEDLAAQLAPLRRALYEARGRRPRPATDDKILTAWNGLMIGAAARAHAALGRPADLLAARRAADFALHALREGDRWRATYRDGRAQLNAYLDDHAFLGRGLVDLYEACFDDRYLDEAAALARIILERFEDEAHGGFFLTSHDHEELLARCRVLHDGALPSGAGVATELLLRLSVHLGDAGFRRAALRSLACSHPSVAATPSAHAALLVAADLAAGPPLAIAVLGAPDDARTRALVARVAERFLPRAALQVGAPAAAGPPALLAGKRALGDLPTAYVCGATSCRPPVTDPDRLADQLDAESEAQAGASRR